MFNYLAVPTQALSGSIQSTAHSLAPSLAWPGVWGTCSWLCWLTVSETGGISYWWSLHHVLLLSSLGGEILLLVGVAEGYTILSAKSETVNRVMSGMSCMGILNVPFDLQVDSRVCQMASGQWQSRRSQEVFGTVCQDERQAFSQTRFRGQDYSS